MLQSMLNFPGTEENSKKLKKFLQKIQHFSEQCRHCIAKQNISIYESLINYEEEKRKKETLENSGL